MRHAVVALALACASGGALASEGPTYTPIDWSDLSGWSDDMHSEALAAFLETCTDLQDPEWRKICAAAQDQTDAKAFFELLFRPVMIEDGEPGLFTGYFEPELKGSRARSEEYRYPLYRVPPELTPGKLWHTRAEIENGLLAGRGLEIAWVNDPVDAFFMQIQGSGRVALAEGGSIRLGYGERNGHEYRSVGQELVRRGIFSAHQVSADTIRNWVKKNPEAGAALLQHNPSFVFFRELEDMPESAGPLGAMNRSVTALRSIAVDPAYVPLGAPVWIEKAGDQPMHRLMIAQDTGSAIKGAQRVDVFYGSGEEAGKAAGQIKDPGRSIVLMPILYAIDLLADG